MSPGNLPLNLPYGFSRKIGSNSTLAFFVSGPERIPNDPVRSPNRARTDSEKIPYGARTIPNGPRTDPERTSNGPKTHINYWELTLVDRFKFENYFINFAGTTAVAGAQGQPGWRLSELLIRSLATAAAAAKLCEIIQFENL